MVAVKICGLKDPGQVREVAALGPEVIGFVRSPGKRRIADADLKRAAAERTRRDQVLWAGVFVDREPEQMAREADLYGFDILQLHGRESPAAVEELRRLLGTEKRIFKAITPEALPPPEEYLDLVDAFLVDAAVGRGGTGKTWDFGRLRRLRERCPGVPLWLAGGLTVENVARAISAARPDGVDVSSGVEGGIPGIKDMNRVRLFLKAVRSSKMGGEW